MTKRGETVKETCNTISPKNLLKVNNGRNSQQWDSGDCWKKYETLLGYK